VLENLDLVLLAVDEIVDRGLILETEPQVVASRVGMRGADGDVPAVEQVRASAVGGGRGEGRAGRRSGLVSERGLVFCVVKQWFERLLVDTETLCRTDASG